MGVGLAQLTSSGSQRDTTWVGGGGSHTIVLQANLGEEAQPQSISQQDLGQPCWSASSGLSRESTLGFGFLVPCFSKQHKFGRKNQFRRKHNVHLFLDYLGNPCEEQDNFEWPNSLSTLHSPEGTLVFGRH